MDYFSDPDLIKTLPTHRAAYSDRTAWMLAEMSRLAYEPHPSELSAETSVAEIRAAVAKGDDDTALTALIQKAIRQSNAPTGTTDQALSKAGFKLIRDFSVDGTDGFLAAGDPAIHAERPVVLAFRGGERCAKDVRTHLKAALVNARGGGKVHAGFEEAYFKVAEIVESDLQMHADLPLFVCGHSLGGALALVATRYLASANLAATYTYGCPRVADDAFFEPVRTPVYRIVNAADAVTRLPFGYVVAIMLVGLRIVPFNGTRAVSEWIRRHFFGYTHCGNLSFLSAPPNQVDEDGIPFKGLVLKESPNIFWRVHVVLWRWIATRGKAAVSDHSILEYCQKLEAYARRRNVR